MDKIKDAWIPYSLSQTQKRHPTTLSPQQWSPTGLQITFFLLRRFCDDSLRLVVRFETSSFGDPGWWRWLGFCSALQDRCRWPGRRGRVGGGHQMESVFGCFFLHVDSKLPRCGLLIGGFKLPNITDDSFFDFIESLGAFSEWRERSKVVKHMMLAHNLAPWHNLATASPHWQLIIFLFPIFVLLKKKGLQKDKVFTKVHPYFFLFQGLCTGSCPLINHLVNGPPFQFPCWLRGTEPTLDLKGTKKTLLVWFCVQDHISIFIQ